jgi:hypothetical protein
VSGTSAISGSGVTAILAAGAVTATSSVAAASAALALAAGEVLGLGSLIGTALSEQRAAGLISGVLSVVGRSSFTTLEPPPVPGRRVCVVRVRVRIHVVQAPNNRTFVVPIRAQLKEAA